MSSQRSDDPAIPVKGADGANQPSHVQHDHDEQRPESTAPVAEKQTGGFPAVGKAMAPLTQPVNYAIKGTTRALNSTVGVTVGVANGLVLGTTGVLGHAAEAVLPKGGLFYVPDFFSFTGQPLTLSVQTLVNLSNTSQTG